MRLDALRTNTDISVYNRNAANSYLKMSEDAKKLGLKDEQTVKGNESRYNLDGTLKEEHLPIGAAKTEKAKEEEEELNPLKDESEKQDHIQGKHDGFDKACPMCECETCKNRRYQDDSDDSAVSFQAPTKMSPAAAQSRVRGHEMEHVRREQAKAKESGSKVVYQSVQIKTDTCEECGRIYVAGGLTRTVTRTDMRDFHSMFMLGFDGKDISGKDIS